MMFWWTPTFVVFGPNINDPSGIYLGAKCGSLKDFQGMHIPRAIAIHRIMGQSNPSPCIFV